MPSEGFRTVVLGDVLNHRDEKLAADEGAKRGLPIIAKISFDAGEIHLRDSRSKTDLIIAKPGDLVVSGINALKGAIALNETGETLAATIHYAAYELNTDLVIPSFLITVLRSSRFQQEAILQMDSGVKTEVKPKRFLPLEIGLPPLDVQRRMVEVIGAAQRVSMAATDEAAAARTMLATARGKLIDNAAYDEARLGDSILGIDAGKSPRCPDRSPAADEWGVLKVSSVRPGEFNPTEAKALATDVPPFTASAVQKGDVLTVRGSGSRRLIGAVCKVTSDPGHLLLSDLVLRIRFDEGRVNTDYIVHALSSGAARAQIEEETKGTTTLGKISRAIIRELTVPLPELGEQAAVAERLDAMADVARQAEREAQAARVVTQALAENLIAGECDIPETVPLETAIG